jgi:hypothetical protein
MSLSRACTEVCTPRRISLSVSRANHRSINRPWEISTVMSGFGGSLESLQVALDAGDNA